MVVPRRIPTAPAPPASRTASSQQVSRAMKGKAPQSVQEPSSLHTNGDSEASSIPNSKTTNTSKGTSEGSPPLTKKIKSKNGKVKKGGKDKSHEVKSNGPFDFLIHSSFFLLAIYLVTFCPTDQGPQHALCRGFYEYRHKVLEPLFVRPVQIVLAHPFVSPYVARVEPHVHHAVRMASPVVLRAHAKWNAYVISQWNTQLVPQWNKLAVPQIRRLERVSRPYRVRLEQEYSNRILPPVRVAAHQAWHLKQNVQPYVVVAASKTYDHYNTAKPYVIPVLRQIQASLGRLLLVLRTQRRRFVDPHVAKIWEKVKELSKGTSTTPLAPIQSPSITSAMSQFSTPSETVESTIGSSSPSYTSTAPTLSDSPVSPLTTVLPDPLPPCEQDVPPAEESTAPIPISTDELGSTDHQAQVAQEHGDDGRSEAPSGTAPVFDTLASASSLMVHDIPTASPAAHSFTDESSSSVAPATSPAQDETNLILDDFVAALGLGDEGLTSESIITEHPQITETAEEETERLRRKTEETAKKRADITQRHAKWEEQLEAQIQSTRKQLRKTLVALRKTAVVELKGSAEIRGQVEFLVTEAEKYLKGAEVYLENLKKETKRDEDKLSLWNRVVSKVEERFQERMRETELLVNNWYTSHLQQEIEEVRKAQLSIKDIAERGQADIGLDYAWLDDVTYEDWQRYHDLIGNSEKFADQANSIQNGTHPSPPINPVLPALEDLQSEVQDIITGFDTRLRRIKRNGERAFGSGQEGEEDVDNESPAEPEISILPIPDQDESGEVQEQDIPPVFLGRSKEEVLEALGKVQSQGTASEDLRAGEGEEDTEPEVAAEAVPVVPDHVEL